MDKKIKTARTYVGARKVSIVKVGLRLAATQGYNKVSARQIARQLGITDAAIFSFYKTIDLLHAGIIEAAIKNNNSRVIVQAIALEHPLVLPLPKKIKKKAFEMLIA